METNVAPPPGWYADPEQPARLRWWDGATWTPHVAPAAAPQYAAPPVDHSFDHVLPVNCDGWAIASGYFGLFSLFPNPVTAIPAVLCGALALSRIRESGKRGRGRALFGIIVGSIDLLLFAAVFTLGRDARRPRSKYRAGSNPVCVKRRVSGRVG